MLFRIWRVCAHENSENCHTGESRKSSCRASQTSHTTNATRLCLCRVKVLSLRTKMVAPTSQTFRPTGQNSSTSKRASLVDKYSSKERVMADTLPPKASSGWSSPQKGEAYERKKAALQELQTNLRRYARGNDRRMAIRSLADCRALRAISMDGNPSSPNSHDEFHVLEREVCLTSIELNGLLFKASASNQILKILTELCHELCRESRLSFQSIYQAMIVRLARTTTSADSYFHLNALLGSQDLVLQSRSAQTPSSHLNMYEADGTIHANLTTYHAYGLFRRCDVTSGKAWIPLLAAVHERVNFRTGDCFRTVNVKVVPDS